MLLVDDEPLFLNVSKALLEKEPEIECVTAGSASEAFARMDEITVDAIVSDYDMPVMDGIEFLKKVRETIPDMPFILLTGRGREEVVIEALNNGVDIYLQKGGDPKTQFAELRHQISLAVERRRLGELYRTIFDVTGTAIVMVDENTTILLANRGVEQFTGYSRGEIEGKKSWMEFIEDDDLERMVRYHRDRWTMSGSAPENYEFGFIDRDGRARTGLLNLRMIPGTRKAIISVVDITVRKQTERDLLDLEDQLETEIRDLNILRSLSSRFFKGGDFDAVLQEILEAAIALTDADKGNLQLLDPSTGMLKIVVQKHFKSPFLKFFEYVDAGEATACGAALKRMERVILEDISRGPVFDDETREVLLEEDIHAVQSTPLVSWEGRLLGILSTHFCRVHTPAERELRLVDILARQAADMIERHQVEQTLRESREQYRQLVRYFPYGIVIHREGTILFCNKAVIALLGADNEEDLIGRPVLGFVHPDCRDLVAQKIQQLQSGELRMAPPIEETLIHLDGSFIDVEITGGPVTFEGEPAIQVVINDITERKLTDNALRESAK